MKIKRRKKQITALVTFMLAVLLVFAAMPYRYFEVSAIDTSKDNEDALKAKLSQYQNESAEIKKKLDSTKGDIAAKENEKQYLDSLVLTTENEIETATNLLAEYDANIAQLQTDIESTSADIDVKYDEVLGRMAFVYEEENYENYLDMLFNSESLSDALMTAERIGSMLDFDQTLMSELSAKLELLKGRKEALSTAREEQEALSVTLEQKKTELQGQIADVDRFLADLQADASAYQAQYAKAEKAEQEVNDEIEKLLVAREEQRKAANQQAAEKAKKNTENTISIDNTDNTPAAASVSGGFIWPVPTSYRTITSRFANGHRGIDIPFSYGTNVYAAKGGTVVTATWHYSYGYYVLIDHGDGSSTLYAHNSKLLVSAGDRVSQGTVIAKGGNTGNSYGNHCHFEVRINGKLANPLNYVPQP